MQFHEKMVGVSVVTGHTARVTGPFERLPVVRSVWLCIITVALVASTSTAESITTTERGSTTASIKRANPGGFLVSFYVLAELVGRDLVVLTIVGQLPDMAVRGVWGSVMGLPVTCRTNTNTVCCCICR